MSHFPVTVKLTSVRMQRHGHDAEKALGEILAPYEEGTDDKRFLVFCDKTDVVRKEFEENALEKIRTLTGELLWPWDDRFQVPGTLGVGSSTHHVPDDCQSVEVPIKQLYESLDAYVNQYHGCERDEETGLYGYWHNPNKTWDWYSVGGRWTGFYPLKSGIEPRLGRPRAFANKPRAGRGDIVKIADIDLDAVAVEARIEAEKFCHEYMAWLKTPTLDFRSLRSRAIDIGLIRVEREQADAGPNEIAIPWRQFVSEDDERLDWTDVARVITPEQFMCEFEHCFNPVATYAALDDEGWHAPGEMGWFGCSSDTPGDFVRFRNEFQERFIKNACGDDTLVCVDCHI